MTPKQRSWTEAGPEVPGLALETPGMGAVQAQEVRGSELVGSGAHFTPAPARISPHLLKLHQSVLPARLFQCPPGPLQPTLPKPVLLFASYQSSDQTPSQAVPCWCHPACWALYSTAFPSCSGTVGQQWSHSSSSQPCWKHPSQQVSSPRFPLGGCSVGWEGGAAPSLHTPGLQSCASLGQRDQKHLAFFFSEKEVIETVTLLEPWLGETSKLALDTMHFLGLFDHIASIKPCHSSWLSTGSVCLSGLAALPRSPGSCCPDLAGLEALRFPPACLGRAASPKAQPPGGESAGAGPAASPAVWQRAAAQAEPWPDTNARCFLPAGWPAGVR